MMCFPLGTQTMFLLKGQPSSAGLQEGVNTHFYWAYPMRHPLFLIVTAEAREEVFTFLRSKVWDETTLI